MQRTGKSKTGRRSETRREIGGAGARKAKLCEVTQRVYFLTGIVTWTFDESITAVVVSGDIIGNDDDVAVAATRPVE